MRTGNLVILSSSDFYTCQHGGPPGDLGDQLSDELLVFFRGHGFLGGHGVIVPETDRGGLATLQVSGNRRRGSESASLHMNPLSLPHR